MRINQQFIFSLLSFVAGTIVVGAIWYFTPDSKQAPSNTSVSNKACVVGGCSGQLCIEQGDPAFSTCELQPGFQCYRSATCERQGTGQCGWTMTNELASCLEAARK